MAEFGVQAGEFSISVRVYYEDTDAGGIVYYANYLRFMERARSDWLRSRGVDATRLRDEHSLMLVVARAQIDYKVPARLDDELQVSVAVERIRLVSIELAQQVRRGTELLASAAVRVGCISAPECRPRPFPSSVLGALR